MRVTALPVESTFLNVKSMGRASAGGMVIVMAPSVQSTKYVWNSSVTCVSAVTVVVGPKDAL